MSSPIGSQRRASGGKITQRLLSDPMLKVYHRMESTPTFELPFIFETRPGYRTLHRTLKNMTHTIVYTPWVYGLLAFAVFAGSLAVAGAYARLARAVAYSAWLCCRLRLRPRTSATRPG